MTSAKLSALQVLQCGPVIPVLVINDVNDAVPLAKALVSGGVRVLEVTLRTHCALDAIARISAAVPDAIVGAGTVTNKQQFADAQLAGSQFIISPGLTLALLDRAVESDLPFIPGISTVSELMMGKDAGLSEFKFFPAEASGGVKAISAVGGPFAGIRFCPTGGITPESAGRYLALPNVVCVGGSWLATPALLKAGNYEKITQLAREASQLR